MNARKASQTNGNALKRSISIVAAVCGTWLLFHQFFRIYPFYADIRLSANDISLLICIVYLSVRIVRFRTFINSRILFGIAILIFGSFVLELAPQKPVGDRILWFESIKLLFSRASPFIGLLVIVSVWNPTRSTDMILRPFRWWLGLPRYVYIPFASLLALFFAASMAWFGYGGIPRVDDGVANLYQARIFASGHLTMPPPPQQDAFTQFGVIHDPRSCSMFPPGYAVVLVLGVFLGIPWLINPLITGITIPIIEQLANTLFGRKTAALTTLCFAFSPFLTIVGASFMNHSLTMLLLASSTLLMVRSHGRMPWIIGAGFLTGLAVLARPFTAFIWGLGLSTAYCLSWKKSIPRAIFFFGLGAFPGAIAWLLFNLIQTGGELTPAPVFLNGPEFALGFGMRVNGVHTILRAISHTTTRIESLGRIMLGWPLNLALLPLVVMILPGPSSFPRKSIPFAIIPPLFILIGHAVYWGLEITHGPRFMYSSLCVLIPITAHAILILPEKLTGQLNPVWKPRTTAALTGGLLLSLTYSLSVTWPEVIRVFGDHYGCEIDLPRIIDESIDKNRLIFFVPVFENPHYGWAFLLNDLDFKGSTVVARESGYEINRKIMALYPDYHVLYYRYNLWERRGVLSPNPFP